MTPSSSTLETGRLSQPNIATVELSDESELSTSSATNRAAVAWIDRQLNPYRAAAIKSHAGASFLDVGCGNGHYVLHFQEAYRTAGIDIQEYPQWEEAASKFRTGDATCLPYDDQSFDTIVSFETLEHVPDPEAALREFHRVCRDSIIISVPNCEIPPGLESSRLTYFHYTDRSHVNFFTPESLRATLRESGFEPVILTSINPCPIHPLLSQLLPIPKLMTRLLVKLASRNPLNMTLLAVASRRPTQ